MNNFHFTKIIASVSPLLAKEIVLSKIINLVDVFSITLSHGFDDNNKKYIDTLMKLDNSKTIILETRGHNTRVKNTTDIQVKKWQTLVIDYSEYTQESDTKIYIDYGHLDQLSQGDQIVFEHSKVVAEVSSITGDCVECKIIKAETDKVLQYDRVTLPYFEDSSDELSSQDQKDILRGLEYGTHIVALSCCNSADHVLNCRQFLEDANHDFMKIFAKIETENWFNNIDSIARTADGIILVIDRISAFEKKDILEKTLENLKNIGVPILVTYAKKLWNDEYSLYHEETIQKICNYWVAWIMLETLVDENTVYDTIETLGNTIEKYELNFPQKDLARFENTENEIRDYLIFSTYRITTEMDIKAIICFTENGYTASKIASLNPKVPIITFTKENDTYRFLNLIRGVKGYKISQSFDYESLKRIGKEMIRIIFKGNISLDDKVLIVQANEDNSDEKKEMNGIELYNFKNI